MRLLRMLPMTLLMGCQHVSVAAPSSPAEEGRTWALIDVGLKKQYDATMRTFRGPGSAPSFYLDPIVESEVAYERALDAARKSGRRVALLPNAD